MRVKLVTLRNMAKEPCSTHMVKRSTRVSGKMAREKDTEQNSSTVSKYTRASGRMTKKMGQEQSLLALEESYMRALGRIIKRVAMG